MDGWWVDRVVESVEADVETPSKRSVTGEGGAGTVRVKAAMGRK